jgi:hypothetical protein
MATLARDPRKTERIALSPRRRALDTPERTASASAAPASRGRRTSLGHPDLVRRAQPCRCEPATGE